jgi:hypothetical protein
MYLVLASPVNKLLSSELVAIVSAAAKEHQHQPDQEAERTEAKQQADQQQDWAHSHPPLSIFPLALNAWRPLVVTEKPPGAKRACPRS